MTVAGSKPCGISDGRRAQDRGAERDAERAANHRQHEAFREQLANDAPPAGAERRPHRELARARALARASSRFATLAQQISSTKPTTPRNSIDVSLRSLPIIVSCIGSSATPRPALVSGTHGQAVGDRRQIGLRRVDGDARLHPPDDLQLVRAARPRRQVDERPHRPDAGAPEDLEARRARRRRRSTASRPA